MTTSLVRHAFLSLAVLWFGSHATSYADQLEDIVSENEVRDISVEQAKAFISAYPDIVVLDVRTPREFSSGHIEGAENVNYLGFDFRLKLRDLSPDKTYLVHCRSGHRSERAVQIMQQEGLTRILHMDGGFNAWKDAEFAVSVD